MQVWARCSLRCFGWPVIDLSPVRIERASTVRCPHGESSAPRSDLPSLGATWTVGARARDQAGASAIGRNSSDAVGRTAGS